MARHRRKRAWLIPGVLLLCIGIPIGCSDSLILGENRQTIDPGAARREMVRVDSRAVECWIARSPGASVHEPTAFVVFFIGKGGRADQWVTQVADSWGDKPVELWGMNYPGSGGSDGPVRVRQVGPDALAVYDKVRSIAGDRPIFVQGGSFGTTAALCVAAAKPVAGLILQNPPPLRQLILGNYGWWNLWLAAGPLAACVPDDLDSLANARRCTAPAIFLLSENDRVVPIAYQEKVAAAYAGPKRVIHLAGGHDDRLPREAAEQLAAGKDWMWETSRRASTRPGQ